MDASQPNSWIIWEDATGLCLINTGFAFHFAQSINAIAQFLKYSVKAPGGILTR